MVSTGLFAAADLQYKLHVLTSVAIVHCKEASLLVARLFIQIQNRCVCIFHAYW